MANRSAIPKRVLDVVWKRDEGVCRYCGEDVGFDFEIDHIKPHSKGGPATVSNLALACRACNRKKGDADWSILLRPAAGDVRKEDIDARLSALEAMTEAAKVKIPNPKAMPEITYSMPRSQSQFEEDIRRKAEQEQFGDYDDE